MKAFFAIVLAASTFVATPVGRDVASVLPLSGAMLTHRASFDGRRLLLAGFDAPTASLWDVDTGLRIQEFVGHTEGVRSVALSPDGHRVLTGAGSTATVRPSTDNSVRLWDIASGRELSRFDGMTYPVWSADPVFDVAFSDDGREALGVGGTRGLAIWDTETAKLLFQQPRYWSWCEDSLRAGFVITREVSRNWVRIWDYRSGHLRERALIGPDGRRILSEWFKPGKYGTSGPYTSLWDVDSGRELVQLDQLQRPLGFSPDGRTIPVVYGPSSNGMCCRLDSLLDAATGQPIRRFQR